MLHMHERAGMDPPPRKWVGESFPRPRAREFLFARPCHPKSGLLGFGIYPPTPLSRGAFVSHREEDIRTTAGRAQGQCANVMFAQSDYKDFAKAFFRADVRQPWNRRAFSNRLRQKVFCPDSCLEWSARALQGKQQQRSSSRLASRAFFRAEA